MNLFMNAILAILFISVESCLGNPLLYNDTSEEYDTIVVGLGAAGTVAASTLARAGKRVLALEAQDRIGGRVQTAHFGDGVVEIGAEWLHGTEDSRTYRLAIENNITILPQDLRSQMVLSDGVLAGAVVDEIIDNATNLFEEKSEKAEPLGNYFIKKLLAKIEQKTPDVFENKKILKQILDYIRQEISNQWGAYDSNDLNAADAYESIGGHQSMSWHRHGYKTFFDLLLNKYKNGTGLPSLIIKLNTPVTLIESPREIEGKVKVTIADGTIYRADNVIVTVSLGVLKERYKTLFSSPLPQTKVTAIEKIRMGLIGKIIFSFDNSWWTSKDLMYGFLWSEDDLNKIDLDDKWTTKLTEISSPMGSTNTLTVWTSGDVTKQVESMSDEIVKTKTMGILRRFMGTNITVPEPTAMLSTKWFTNEFTRGTYSYDSMASVDWPSARSELATPILDAAGKPRILFAGEATHHSRFATVHGAADTGHREASRILGTI